MPAAISRALPVVSIAEPAPDQVDGLLCLVKGFGLVEEDRAAVLQHLDRLGQIGLVNLQHDDLAMKFGLVFPVNLQTVG